MVLIPRMEKLEWFQLVSERKRRMVLEINSNTNLNTVFESSKKILNFFLNLIST